MEKMKVEMLKCPKCGEEYESLLLVNGEVAKKQNEEAKQYGERLYYPDIDYNPKKNYYMCYKCKYITDKKVNEVGGFKIVEREFPKITCPNCGFEYSMTPSNRCRLREKKSSEEYMCPKCWTAMSKEIIEAGAKWGIVMGGSLDWLDHTHFEGERFISEPYQISYEGIKEIIELCEKYGLSANIYGKAEHHPDCVRVEVYPAKE
jgi:predicted RNA-binding Zn-ribbon protein involved in translation (DUF1610 family)